MAIPTLQDLPAFACDETDWPRISIVTPCYNKAEYVEDTMLSVLRQGYPNLEYIVVDGGSTDGSLDIIKKYAEELAWWVSEPDDGMYHALQKGLNESSGEIMGWINADDLLHRRSLFTLGEIFYKFPDVEWIQGYPTFIDEMGRIVRTAQRLQKWSRFDYYLGNFRWIQQESTFWRRSLWEKAGGYIDTNLSVAGDLELWARFFRHAPLYVTEAVLGAFRMCQEGQLSQTHMETYLKEAAVVLQRERQQLNESDRHALKRLRQFEKFCKALSRIRLPGIHRIYRYIRVRSINLPPVIRFDRDSQSYLKQP